MAIDAADAVEQRGFAGTVRSDQTADLIPCDIEGDAAEGDDAAEAHRHVDDAEQGVRVGRAGACHQPDGACNGVFPRVSRVSPSALDTCPPVQAGHADTRAPANFVLTAISAVSFPP